MLFVGELVHDRQQDVPGFFRAAQFVEGVGEVDEAEWAVRHDLALTRNYFADAISKGR